MSVMIFCSNIFSKDVVTGSERFDILLPMLKNKRVGLIVNQSSIVGDKQTHLIDTLLALDVNIKAIFAPEHGFRGNHDAGETVKNTNIKNINVYSLYGKTKKPTKEMLKDIDILVYDIQDVGVRFFTYISTLHYAMEATAENDKKIIVCDRPNPNDFVDGPLLQKDCRSFVGMDPIPVVYGLTVGELARMINEERWLDRNKKCDLTVVKCLGWKHGDKYSVKMYPSPNLRSDEAIRAYPSLCLFEPTIMSVGRGTDNPFTAIGYTDKRVGDYVFTPKSIAGVSANPKYKNRNCYGEKYDISGTFTLKPVIETNKKMKSLGYKMINDGRTFELLIGNKSVLRRIENGESEEEISKSWQEELSHYKDLRQLYLLY